jgi:hypothetical protein
VKMNVLADFSATRKQNTSCSCWVNSLQARLRSRGPKEDREGCIYTAPYVYDHFVDDH